MFNKQTKFVRESEDDVDNIQGIVITYLLRIKQISVTLEYKV